MKSKYKQPIVASFLDEIRSTEEANRKEISTKYPKFSEGLNFTKFVSPDTLELLCDFLVTHDASYRADDTLHWFNRIRSLHVDSITSLIDTYVSEQRPALTTLDDVHLLHITARLHALIERECSGLTSIIDAINTGETNKWNKEALDREARA